ncbi:serine/threonine protein kinase [Labilithrix luteola]|uniref:Serine/threonine protein kinase n=1 Tax=Labilithrix luteola TaxID=1391654 RepID=A0A0K1QB48_9BACT|nr:serine/threonine-protein kinase [Labilithrix luteola]AKV02964.1 serine/threonine protein kinase [Labilithrix luteola]
MTSREATTETRGAETRTIAGYRLLLRLGTGSFSEVWEGCHEVSNERAAIKVLHKTASPAARAQFVKETRTLARLWHEHIASAFAFGDDYIVSALIEGTDLEQRLQTPIEPRLAIRITVQVGSALDYAHSNDVVHRDVKPSNILVDTNDNAFLADFGLATLEGDEALRGAGTIEYMPPEQAAKAPPHPSMDQYALARTLLQMLTGRTLPPIGEDAFRDWPSALPNALRDVLARALAENPKERFSRVSDFVDALGAIDLSAYPAPTVIAEPLRRSEPFAWVTAASSVVDHSALIKEARFSLVDVVERSGIDAERTEAFRRVSGYENLGWSLFTRTDRLGTPTTPEALARARGLVVMLPGMMYSRRSWSHIARAVLRDRAQTAVLTAEFLGFQESRYQENPPGTAYRTPRQQMSGILAWLELLGVRPIPTTIVGHSILTVPLLSMTDDELGPTTNRLAVTPIVAFANRQWQFDTLGVSVLEKHAKLLEWAVRPIVSSKIQNAVEALDPRWQVDALANVKVYPFATLGAFARYWRKAPTVAGEDMRRCKWLCGTEDPTVPLDAVARAQRESGFDQANLHWSINRGHYPHLPRADEPEASVRNVDQIVRLIGALQRDVDDGSSAVTSGTEISS